MSYIVNEAEYRAVIALPPLKRYEYFIKKVADFEEVWSLWKDGWSLAADNVGNEGIPVWPAERYAAACATEDWANYEPRPIAVSDWMEKWLPGMTVDRKMVAVFPTKGFNGIMLNPERVKQDLEVEMRRYSGVP